MSNVKYIEPKIEQTMKDRLLQFVQASLQQEAQEFVKESEQDILCAMKRSETSVDLYVHNEPLLSHLEEQYVNEGFTFERLGVSDDDTIKSFTKYHFRLSW